VPDEDAEKMTPVQDAVESYRQHAKGKKPGTHTSTGSHQGLDSPGSRYGGVGLVCALGSAGESWKTLVAGQSGVGRLRISIHALRLQDRRREQELRSIPVDERKKRKNK